MEKCRFHSGSNENVDKINVPFVKTVAEPLINSVIWVKYHRIQLRGFYPKICTCEGCSLSPTFSQASKGSVVCKRNHMFWASKSAQRVFYPRWLRVINCGGFRNKASIKPVEVLFPKKARQIKSNIKTMLICSPN